MLCRFAKMLTIICILKYVFAQSNVEVSNVCRKFVCGDADLDQCAKFESRTNTITVSGCASSSDVCDHNVNLFNADFSAINCVARITQVALKIPGEPCLSDNDCLSNKCMEKICRGIEDGYMCDTNSASSCDVGLYCFTSICEDQRVIGESCTNSYQCVNSAFCDKHTSTCIAYLSLENDEASITPNGVAYECKSMYSANGLCDNPPQSMADYSLKPCNSDWDCLLSDQTFSECQCGYNDAGNRCCKAAYGDPVYAKIKQTLENVLKVNRNCASAFMFSPQCSAINQDAMKLNMLKSYAEIMHLTYQTPKCMKQALMNWTLEYDLETIPKANSYASFALNGKQQKQRKTLILTILGVCTGTFLVIVIGFIIYKKYKEHKYNIQLKEKDEIVEFAKKPKPSTSDKVYEVDKNKKDHEGMRQIIINFDNNKSDANLKEALPAGMNVSGIIALNDSISVDQSKILEDPPNIKQKALDASLQNKRGEDLPKAKHGVNNTIDHDHKNRERIQEGSSN